MIQNRFKTKFSEDIFNYKYRNGPNDTWDALAERVVEDVCGTRWGTTVKLMSDGDRAQLAEYIKQMKFLPGGRYLYYAGRPAKYFNNCFIGIAREDSREEWAHLVWWAMRCLTVGGGIGIDYSVFRGAGRPLTRTGGLASGPIPLMMAINEIGRNVMQGGSRRSAIYASLHWSHEDISAFLKAKNWDELSIGLGDDDGNVYTVADAKVADFNFNAPLDMTNISVNYDDSAGNLIENPVFLENCFQAMRTGEPGFSFNFGDKARETGRNALTTSALH
jgi:ribonucleoside-diphosphate reductase alpha chain